MSVILNFDELREKKEKKGFIVGGKTYYIPEVTHKKLIRLQEINEEIRKNVKKDDLVGLSSNQIDLITYLIPDLSEEMLRDEFGTGEIKALMNLITIAAWGVDEDDAELVYYREKYKDEYRKNLQRTGENKKK